MDCYTLVLLACIAVTTSAWSTPFYPVQRAPPQRVTRFAPLPHRHIVPFHYQQPQLPQRPNVDRPKRDHYDEDGQEDKPTSGVTGPVHTFVKTDKNANYKWGVRHHVGNKYTS